MLAMPLHASTHYDPRANVSIAGPTMKILCVDPGIHGGLALIVINEPTTEPTPEDQTLASMQPVKPVSMAEIRFR
jgi:hypothetical protein